MKKLLAALVTVLFVVGVVACKSESDTPAVDVSAEMKAFAAAIKGKSSDVSAALKAHGTAGLASADMDDYDLKDAKVVKAEKQGTKDCYLMEAKAGVTTRSYNVCWESGKIVSVEDKGMR